MDKLLVTLFTLLGAVFVYWFFRVKKVKPVKAGGEIKIEVNGGYRPEVIALKLRQTSKLIFFRTDPNECLSELIIPDFKIKRELPVNTSVEVVIYPDKVGEFIFHCGMNMYQGKLQVSQ